MSDNSPYEAPESDVSVSSGQTKLTLQQICFSFEGRVPRKVFWLYGFLGVLIVSMVLGGVVGFLIAMVGEWLSILLIPIYILMIWVSLAIQVKRWHDRDKSGWWWLIAFIPLIGFIWQLVECGFLEGTQGDNRFGPAPGDY